jgi:hypothetical protein
MRMLNANLGTYRLMLRSFATLPILFAATFFAQAADTALPPGEYITERGWGSLKIAAPAKGAQTFSLDSYGANAHICGLEGKIVGDRGIVDAEDGDSACFLRFVHKGSAIDVISGHESCRDYCGARAGFEGVYLKPAPGCESAAIKQTRGTFKTLYDRKQYRQALNLLSPLPNQCAKTLDWLESPAIVNDIAITQYKLGMRDACLKTLAPLQENAELSDDEIREGYPPSDAENYLPLVKATRTNLRLCRSLKTK